MKFDSSAFYIVAVQPYTISWDYSNKLSKTSLCPFKFKNNVISSLDETVFLSVSDSTGSFVTSATDASIVELEPTSITCNFRIKCNNEDIFHNNGKLYYDECYDEDTNSDSFKLKSTWIFIQTKINPNHLFVIARYNETPNWTRFLPGNVIIYNKGKIPIDIATDFDTRDNIRVEILENVGREGHTYLHHIVTNFNNSASLIFGVIPFSNCFFNQSLL